MPHNVVTLTKGGQMLFGRLSLVAAAVALAATPAASQVKKDVQLTAGSGVLSYGTHVGPYRMQVLSDPGKPVIDVFCVDFLNGISLNKPYKAYWTMFTDPLNKTRFGGTHGLTAYKRAAWISLQFKNYAKTPTNWGGIHAALWNIFTPANPTNSQLSAAQKVIRDNLLAASVAGAATIDVRQWAIITDERVSLKQTPNFQEFITMVPEPETLVLLGTGLLTTLGIAMLRRRAA